MVRSSLKSVVMSREIERQFDFGGNNTWLPMPDAEVAFFPDFFEPKESDRFFQTLIDQTKWRQEKIRIYGKDLDLPRLTAWYGDPGKSYSYSGISMQPEPWTDNLISIKRKVDSTAGVRFNSVLLSLYRTGQDSLSWHQDDEPELGDDPVIASVSFGDTRSFQFRHKAKKDLNPVSIPLTHGSLLMMKGSTQRFWVHQVPKTSKPVGPRINLTFRVIRDY
jgi:alkylated DNA repair dioxygenase AlkB